MHMVVFITVGKSEEAEKIGRALVKERLAACVNVIGPMRSVYWWKGKIEEAKEHLLIVKTTGENLEGLTSRVKGLHSYEVPEVIALKIEGGSDDYLRWVEENTSLVG